MALGSIMAINGALHIYIHIYIQYIQYTLTGNKDNIGQMAVSDQYTSQVVHSCHA